MKRILVVKLADIGDVLTATPALRSLRRTFPHAHISALVAPHCRGILANPGLAPALVDEEITFAKANFDRPAGTLSASGARALAGLAVRLRRGHFDTLVLLHHLTTPWGARKYALLAAAAGAPIRAGLDNGRGGFLTHRAADAGFGAKHEVAYWNDVVGLLGASPDYGPLAFPVAPSDSDSIRLLLPETLPRPWIVLHPGSGAYSLARRWPADGFAAVAATLTRDRGATIVVVGGEDEGGLAAQVTAGLGQRALNLTGRTTLGELAALLRSSDLFVGNDGGVMHLAAAVGTPVVALFGPSNHRAWGPWAPKGRAVVLRADLPCLPCFYTGHSLGTPQGCPARTCLQLITVDQVVSAIEHILADTVLSAHPGHPSP